MITVISCSVDHRYDCTY